MAGVTVQGISKRFGDVYALSDVDLTVHDGEFLTVLGPSGSGKSTLLRILAGLEIPNTGRVTIGVREVCGQEWVPPQARNVGLVFQNYALWPHMTAWENVAFPLEMAGLSQTEIQERVRETLSVVELAGHEMKRPDQMSGGEQQRVALARALVGRPALLLMDECLSNLDARLRGKMAGELRHIQTALGITTIYVTHDQHEALALSDRIAVLHRGRLQQVGHPVELYRRPCNPLVASALGPINLLTVEEATRLGLATPRIQGPALLGVRPEQVVLVGCDGGNRHFGQNARQNLGQNKVLGRVVKSTFMGDSQHCWIETGSCRLHARMSLTNGLLERIPTRGEEMWLTVDPKNWIVMADRTR